MIVPIKSFKSGRKAIDLKNALMLLRRREGEAAAPVAVEVYLADPCAVLPAPYSVCSGKKDGAVRLAGKGIPSGSPVLNGAFCRVFRGLTGDIRRASSDLYSVRQLYLTEDEGDRALFDSAASAFGVTASEVSALPHYLDELCVSVHERGTGACSAVAFGGFDPVVGEAWIGNVLCPSASDGAISLAVNELIRRMARLAPFATACAEPGSALERALRKAGFTGGDIWLFREKLSPPYIIIRT